MMKIDSTKFGEITINGRTYYSDVTVFWDGSISYRQKDHVVSPEEFARILKKNVSVLVVGIGHVGIVRVPEEVHRVARMKNVHIYEMKSHEAVDLFNGFVSQGKKVAAIIHTTC